MKQLLFLSILSIFIFSCSSVKQDEEENTNDTSSVSEGGLASYSYKTYRINSSKPLDGMDTTFFKLIYPVFSDAKINDYIQQKLVLDSGKNTVEEMGNQFINDYDEFYDQVEYKRPWYQEKTDSVAVQTKSYIGFRSYLESYTGGAHGNFYTNFFNYDVQQNKEIPITALINDYPALTTLAEDLFRKQEGISKNHSLTDGYFFEEGIFSLPNNFILEKEGILFLYNIYEIKPYVSGPTELVIPYTSLENLLSTEAKAIIAEIKK